MISYLDKQDLMEEMTDEVTLVDFFANWCSPCRMMGPVLDEVSAEHPEWTAVKVDCDTLQELAFRFGVSSIPHFEVIVDGKSVGNIVGARENVHTTRMAMP